MSFRSSSNDDAQRRLVEQSCGRKAVPSKWSGGYYYVPILLPKPRIGYFMLGTTMLLTNLLGWVILVTLCWLGFSHSALAGIGTLIGGLFLVVPAFYVLAPFPAALIAMAFDCWLPEGENGPGTTKFALMAFHAAFTGTPHWGQSE